MAETPTDVLVAGYQDIDEATRDFEALVALVKEKKVEIEGVILVTHAQDGSVAVRQTGDNLGRKGMGWGGGVGLAVGLFAPPLLASVAVGAVAGGVIGKFVDHRVENEIHDKIGENLPPGSAGIIAVFDDAQRLGVEQALAGALLRSVVQGDKKGTAALKESLAEAMGKFSPDRTVLPIPDPNFGGTIGRTLDASVADWTINMTPKPPEGAPNVLLVLIDDAGFGNPSTFGGPAETPAMTRVAEQGLRYNRFHVTALCSPTRAALLTGRNHHTVGFGSIGEFPGPFPGYSANVPKDCAPFVRALQGNGYSTAGFGKWHLTPDHVQGAAGPFDRWPNAWGFDRFWGILGGEAGQYDPVITQDNTTLGVPEGEDGKQYYWPDDLTDQAVRWLHEVRAQDQEKPWFIYYSTGCSHAPHQVALEWSEKYRGKFDQGWDVLREETFERQKKLGVIPADAVLTPRPDELPAWDSLSESEKKLYARQMEVYAGFQENADWNVGRLLDEVAEMGELENTLVIYIFGDNGASLEGTITGSFNELTMQNGIALTAEQQLSLIEQYGGLDAWGTDAYAPHYASAWAWAGNAPFQWGKQVASHLGGTRNGMVVSWPKRIKDAGGLRAQFTHCIDIGPTILEAAGIPEPEVVDGTAQKPMEGTSFLYSFEDANAPERHTVQYFEIVGNRAIYKDGWWAACKLDRIPWDISPPTMARFAPGAYDPEQDTWELYYLPDDLQPGERPRRRESGEARRAEGALLGGGGEAQRAASARGVLGLLRDPAADADDHDPDLLRRRREYRLRDDPAHLRPLLRDRGGARCSGGRRRGRDRRRGGRDGRLLALGRRERPPASQLLDDGRRAVQAGLDSPDPDRGRHGPDAVSRPTGRNARPAARVSLFANDEKIGEGRIEKTVAVRFSGYAGMDIGRDNGLPVDRAYAAKAPYPFTGTVKKVVFDLKPGSHDDEKALHESGAHVATAHGISA